MQSTKVEFREEIEEIRKQLDLYLLNHGKEKYDNLKREILNIIDTVVTE